MRRVMTISLTALIAVGFAGTGTGMDRSQEARLVEHLESRADLLESRLMRPYRMGALERSSIRGQLAEIEAAVASLESGGALASTTVSRLLGRSWTTEDRGAEAIVQELRARSEIMAARLTAPRKLGMMERLRLREEIDRLETRVARIESGEVVAETRRVRPESAGLEIRRARMERRLGPARKIGMAERVRIRQEIEALDALISELEREAAGGS